MSTYLEAWKNRCDYSAVCSIYCKEDYCCSTGGKECTLYPIFQRVIIQENKEDLIKKHKGLERILITDGTAYLG